MARGGHPLGLIEHVIERVRKGFLPFELHKLSIFGICINPKGCPPLVFINLKVFRGVLSSSFHQSKGFRGMPSSSFHPPRRVMFL